MANHEAYLTTALNKYTHKDIAKRDIQNAFQSFKDLRPTLEPFVFNDGTSKELLCLEGTIPVIYKGNTYNIPILLWLIETHPYNPPIVYVKPTETMQIKPGRHVDSNGKVFLPYLHDWRYPESDLMRLMQVLTVVFGEEPPVFAKTSTSGQSSPAQPTITNYEAFLRTALIKYTYRDSAKRDIQEAFKMYTDFRPTLEPFVLNDGTSKELLCLDGTIPVTYKGNTYNIPILLWLNKTHPHDSPIVYVKPTQTMQIKPGRHVDSNGKVFLPYMCDWRYPQSDLTGLVQVLTIVFGEEPPLFAKTSTSGECISV